MAYPSYHVRLHLDDAAAAPVCAFLHHPFFEGRLPNESQTIRDLSVLRCNMGKEAVTAVNEHVRGQYDKRQLNSKSARATYIQTTLLNKQYPYIWKTFWPGNMPVGADKLQYDDVSSICDFIFHLPNPHRQKRRGRFQSAPVLRAFSVYWSAHGIRQPITPSDPGKGNRPIGALAMAAAAVSLVSFGGLGTSF